MHFGMLLKLKYDDEEDEPQVSWLLPLGLEI